MHISNPIVIDRDTLEDGLQKLSTLGRKYSVARWEKTYVIICYEDHVKTKPVYASYPCYHFKNETRMVVALTDSTENDTTHGSEIFFDCIERYFTARYKESFT